MSTKTMFTMGFVSMLVVSGVVTGPDTFAAEAQPMAVIERIGAGGSTYSFSQPTPVQSGDSVAGTERRTVAVIERIGAGGSIYSFSQPLHARAGDGTTDATSHTTSR